MRDGIDREPTARLPQFIVRCVVAGGPMPLGIRDNGRVVKDPMAGASFL
jgi:hypothetical protein